MQVYTRIHSWQVEPTQTALLGSTFWEEGTFGHDRDDTGAGTLALALPILTIFLWVS